MNKKKTRSSNVELLRILAMLFIIASHYTVHGLKCLDLNILENYNILPLGGGVGVNLFVMASGYFMVKSCINMTKIAKVLFHTISYAAILSLIAFSVGEPFFDVNLKQTAKVSLGVMGTYWFINTYIGLMLLVPFLNVLAHHISQKQHLLLIIALSALAALLRTHFHIPTYCGQLCLFVTLYMIAAYLRLYNLNHWPKRKLALVLIAIMVVTIALIYTASASYVHFQSEYIYNTIYNFAASMDSLSVLLISILIFTFLIKSNIGSSRIINFLASCTLGVYLFHEHPLMRDFIWQKVLHTAEAPSGEHPVLHCIGAIFGIYIAGTIVEIVWQQTVGRLYAPVEKYIVLPMYSRVKKWGNRVLQLIMG